MLIERILRLFRFVMLPLYSYTVEYFRALFLLFFEFIIYTHNHTIVQLYNTNYRIDSSGHKNLLSWKKERTRYHILARAHVEDYTIIHIIYVHISVIICYHLFKICLHNHFNTYVSHMMLCP